MIKNAGGKPGWGFLPAFLIWRAAYGKRRARLCMDYHDTNSSIWDLRCKSQ